MKVRLADYVADFLVENGITQQFSVTGGGAMFLNDAFGKKKGLNCVYNHHEQACAIAAEGYTRSSGKVCSVCVTTGPGGTNALTGVLGAWLDSIPMFVISGQVKFEATIKSCPNINLRQLGDQEFDIVSCVKTMTKYSVMVINPLEIKYHLKKALYLATHGRCGPVWLDIPINVQCATIETTELIDYDEKEDVNIQPKLDNRLIDELLSELSRSKRPVILVGEGVRFAKKVDEFNKLVEKLNIPVVTAWNAEDIICDDSEFNCGRQGTMGTRGANFVIQSSDLVLSLGCRMSIRQTSYNYENFAKNAKLIAVDIDENELLKPTIKVDVKIHADVGDVICEILSREYTAPIIHKRWAKKAKQVDELFPITIAEYRKKDAPVNPYVFFEVLSQKLNEGDQVVASNGTACVLTSQAFKVKKNQRVFTNSGCASMGYGLPASIGASFALGEKQVVCLEGDGSIQMNIQELQTLVHHKRNIKLFWLNNNGYHSIRQTQTASFNSDFYGVSPESGISFPSAEKIAVAYGIPFFKINKNSDLSQGLDFVLSQSGAIICEIVLDEKQFFEPKLSSKRVGDKIISPSLEDMSPFLDKETFEKALAILKGDE